MVYSDYQNSGSATNYSDHHNTGGWTDAYAYGNHVNYSDYHNHQNYSAPYPQAYTINTQAFSQDAYIKDSIANIKTLRDDINTLSTKKIKSDGTKITTSPTVVNNEDADFAAGLKQDDLQIEETITNIKNLWQAIKGNTDNSWQNWPADTQDDQKITSANYNFLKDKVQTLANEVQNPKPAPNGYPAGTGIYTNHTDTGTP